MWLLFCAALLFSLGGLFMKLSVGLTRLVPSLGIFVCFACGAALQALAMRRAEMGSTYVLVLGLEAVVAFTLGSLFLHERITAEKVAALILIVMGIVLLERPG